LSNTKRLVVLATLAAASGVFAHVDKPHAAKPAVPPEQKDWGIAGDASRTIRTIRVEMQDTIRFVPERMTVRQGQTVRFVIHNRGRTLHEFVIGNPADNQAHAELMKKHPNMEHDEPYMAHVAAGGKGQIVWTFNRAGTFEFACLIAGHYDAGMKGSIVVTPSTSPKGA
jgi:uncharacterized cupredoxin-like copper-binding protein